MRAEKWTYDPENDFHNVSGQCYVSDEDCNTVCIVEDGRKDRAALIAAAPELLAICQWALSHVDNRKTNLIKAMTSVIAKAGGA